MPPLTEVDRISPTVCMDLFRKYFSIVLALFLLVCGITTVKAETPVPAGPNPYSENGKTVIFPEREPAAKRETGGMPFVYYTLTQEGLLIENYYDANGSLRYAFGNVSELYLNTTWPAQLSPYPRTGGFGFAMMEAGEEGKVTSFRTFLTQEGASDRVLPVSWDAFGTGTIEVPEDITEYEDGSAAGRPAMTETIYHPDESYVGLHISSGEQLLYCLDLFYSDDPIGDKLLIVEEGFEYNKKGNPSAHEVYNLTYEGDLLVRIEEYSDNSEGPVKVLEYSYMNGKRTEVTVTDCQNGQAAETYRYGYTDGGLPKTVEHVVNGLVTDSADMVYDDNGRLSEYLYYTWYDSSYGARTTKTLIHARYYYDQKGFLSVLEYETDQDAELRIFTFARNEDGSLRSLTQKNAIGEVAAAIEIGQIGGSDQVPQTGTASNVQAVEPSAVSDEPKDTVYGSQTEVPDGRIRLEVEELIRTKYGNCLRYSYETYHSPDPASHIDTVRILTTAYYQYGGYTTDQTIVFEYNRASDLWTILQNSYWQNVEIFWYPEQFIGIWHGTYDYAQDLESEFELEIKEIDFDRMELTGRYGVGKYSSYWNEHFKLVWYEELVAKEGTFPIDLKSGRYSIGVNLMSDKYTTECFILSPEHGIQFREDYGAHKMRDALKITIVD